MLFNVDELSYLIRAVEEYCPETMSYTFRKDYGQCKAAQASCLEKLNSNSEKTNFTKQEYTYMAVSLNYVLSSMQNANVPIPDALDMLYGKVMLLAQM